MLRAWLWGVIGASIGIGLLTATAMAKPGVVKTKAGQTLEGDVDDRGDTVIVDIRGIQTTVDRKNVASIEYPPSIEEQFAQQRSKLDAKDVKGRIGLARWAFDRRRYDLARALLEEALAIDPNSREATDLAETVHSQIRMERLATESSEESRASSPSGRVAARPSVASGSADRRHLSPADINVIRQMELAADEPVRVRLENDVQRRYVSAYEISAGQFARLTPWERATEIINSKDERFIADVKILEDPRSIREYRGTIQRLILSGCATTSCHGGPAGGSLVLFTNSANSDPVVYTNFYILQNYRHDAGQAGQAPAEGAGPAHRMIDRATPERSLLLQYALPMQSADLPHPDVPGYRPIFSSRRDPRYRQILDWMTYTLSPVQPHYPVDYEMPVGGGSTSRPASRAAMPATQASGH